MEEQLEKATEKFHNWMAGIEPNAIEQTLSEQDNLWLSKFVQKADYEIREHPEKFMLQISNLNLSIFNLFQTQFVASVAQMCHPEMFATN